MDQETSGSTPLFAVFLLSIFSIILIPYTLYAVFGGEDDKEVGVGETCVLEAGMRPQRGPLWANR